MENSRSVENIMSIKALTNDDTDLVQQRNNNNNHNNSHLDNSNNNNNSDSNSSINNTKNFNFVFETFNNGTMSKKKNNEGAILKKKNHISTSKSNNGDSIQGSQIRIFNAKELPNTNTKSIFNRQISMLVKNKEVTDTSQSSSNSLKKFGESVSDYNQSNNKNISLSSASRLNINSETSSPPPLVNTSSSSSSSSSSSTSPYLYLSNNKGRNDNKNNNSNSADNQPRRHKRKNSFSSQHEDDEKETNQEGEKKKKRKNYNYKKKADRLPNVNKLKKPRNGYMIYMNEVYKTVRDRHPQLRFGELSTLIGRQWKSLSKEEQQPYHDMHEKEKTDYDNAKVAMGTSKLHIVEETIDNIMAKKSAISAFSNASFAAFTSSPSASLPLSPQLPPQSKNTKFKKIPSSTKNGVAATNINTNFGKINDSLPTPPLTSPTIATITNNTSSTLSNLTSSSLSVSTTPDKLSTPELIRNKSSNSQALQYSSTIKTNNNINSPQNHTRIIFNENDDQSPLSSTRMLTAVDTRASSTEITPSTKWYLPFEGTSTSPGLSIFRKRKIKSIGETNNNDSDGMNVDNKLKKH